MLTNLYKTPWPFFGGKADAAEAVWGALGDCAHYVEPFAGSPVFRDYGGGNMEPACWPDDWPLDITLDQMRARGVRVVGA